MKIQKVIHSCDDKAFYADFWPIVSMLWKVKFGVEPVLLYFGNGNPTQKYGTVIKMDILPDVPVNTQCQLSRYWLPVTELDTTWMTSDIDMLPISKRHFTQTIEHFSDDKFIALNSDPGETFPSILYSCCYNVAKGRTFAEILQLKPTWSEFMQSGFWKENTHNYTPQGLSQALPHWGADEMWSSRLINQFHDQNRIIRLFRDCGRHRCHRIDRIGWSWSYKNLKSGDYYDCHSLRPYHDHKAEIDRLVEAILQYD